MTISVVLLLHKNILNYIVHILPCHVTYMVVGRKRVNRITFVGLITKLIDPQAVYLVIVLTVESKRLNVYFV